jgi:cytochrome c biogenesis protein CcdA
MDLSALALLKDIPLLYAFAIGVITAIGPCPMSANVTAIAYVSSKFTDSRAAMLAGTMYTVGRAVTYTVIGLLAFALGATVMDSAPMLQDYDYLIFGPALIVVGIVMLGLWKPNLSFGDGLKEKYGLKLSENGIVGAFGLGAVFALAFCPYTAVMFFGLLMPLALQSDVTGLSFMALFGLGTGLPVLAFACLLGVSAAVARGYVSKVTKIEPYVRKVLGAGFLLYGAYMIAEHLLKAVFSV